MSNSTPIRKKLNVLIVGNDHNTAEIVKTSLSMIDEPIHAIEAKNGKEAIDILDYEDDDILIIISELNLEVINGALGLLYKASQVPIIILTEEPTNILDEEIVKIIGEIHFISKPFNTISFNQTIRDLIQKSNRYHEIYLFPNGTKYDAQKGTMYINKDLRLVLGEVSKLAFDFLAMNYPKPVTTDELRYYIYGSDNGNLILVNKVIHTLRKNFEKYEIPLEIKSSGKGRAGGRFFLEEQ